MPLRPANLACAITVLLLTGCGGPTPAPNPETVSLGGGSITLWRPTAAPLGAGLLILAAAGTESEFWAPLAALAASEGYTVAVCAPAPGTPAPGFYKNALAAATRALGPDATRRAVLTEGTAAFEALETLEEVQAVVAVSVAPRAAPESAMRRYAACPLLLLTCENDLESANAARALKAAATGYCELQAYACGVRGVDLLTAAPNTPGQILAWLKPVVGGGIGKSTAP
jgi:hypothetical protein